MTAIDNFRNFPIIFLESLMALVVRSADHFLKSLARQIWLRPEFRRNFLINSVDVGLRLNIRMDADRETPYTFVMYYYYNLKTIFDGRIIFFSFQRSSDIFCQQNTYLRNIKPFLEWLLQLGAEQPVIISNLIQNVIASFTNKWEMLEIGLPNGRRVCYLFKSAAV